MCFIFRNFLNFSLELSEFSSEGGGRQPRPNPQLSERAPPNPSEFYHHLGISYKSKAKYDST